MMKRILVTVLLCISALAVRAEAPWAEHKESVEARERDGKPAAPKPDTVTLLPRILSGQPIRVNIQADWKINEGVCNHLKQQVQKAYNAWFKNAADMIKKRQREYEFQDVLPALERDVPIEANCPGANSKVVAPADLTVDFKYNLKQVQKECKENTVGCLQISRNGDPMKVIVPGIPQSNEGPISSWEQQNNVLLHELGHTLGLADAYKGKNDPHASKTHRSKHHEFNTVMNSGGELSLRPDDADGLINIMDAWTVHNEQQKHPHTWHKHVSPRILKGWNGLDRDIRTGSSKDRYRMGTSTQVKFENDAKKINPMAF